VHPHREIVPLSVRGADLLFIRVADLGRFLDARALRWRIAAARRSGVIFSARTFPAPLAHRDSSGVFAGLFRYIVIFRLLAGRDPHYFNRIRNNVSRALFAFRHMFAYPIALH
jgi:hypothetical protein